MRAGKLFLIWTCLFSIALIGSAQQKGRSRNRRALYSSPSSPEEIKYVVRIETFYSADRVTGKFYNSSFRDVELIVEFYMLIFALEFCWTSQ